MKKKLLIFIAMLAVLACLFAVTAFAAEPDTTRESFTLSDNTVLPIWDKDGNGLIWYKSTLNTEDGYANYDYVSNNQTDSSITPYIAFAKGGPYTRAAGGTNYKGYQLNSITITDANGSYSSKSEKIVLANLQNMMFDENNKFNMFAESFRNSKALEAIYFDTTVDLFVLGLSFENCSKLTYTNLELTKVLEIGGSGVFSNCSSLAEIKLPNTIKTLGHYPFQNTGITEFTIPESVVSVTGTHMFNSCASLKSVNGFASLFQRGVLTEIPERTFNGCSKLTTVDLPETYNSIGNLAFNGCSSLTGTFRVPNTCTSIGTQALQGTGYHTVILGGTYTSLGNNSLREMKNLKNVYISSKITSIPGEVFRSTSNVCFYYTGDSANGLISVTTNTSGYNNTILACPEANQIHFDSWDSTTRQDNQSYIIYGVNECYAFYENKHTLTGTDCTQDDACTICTLAIEGQEAHTLVEALTYVSFLENGVYLCDCTFNGCTAVDVVAEDEASVADPIFGAGDGFSTKGTDGISGGYVVDVEALNEYNRVNKDAKITFGIMVINPNYLAGKDSFLDSAGKVNTTGGALQVDMSATQYQNVSVSITGFTGNVADISLVIALYAYTDAGEVEYIQSQTTKCASANVTLGTQKLYTVTLASVTAGTSTVDGLGDYAMPSTNDDEEQA